MTETPKKSSQDPFLINTLLLTFLVMALALQVLIAVVWAYHFIPIKPSPLVSTLFYRQRALVMPEREMFFYHFFIMTAVFLQAAGMIVLRAQMSRRIFIRQLLNFTLVEYGWVFLMVFTVFKMFVYDLAPWTKAFFYASLILSVLSKVFWKEIRDICTRAMRFWENHGQDTRVHRCCDLFFVLLVFLIVYIPDTRGLLAKMFMTDHFHHFDTMIMAPAWGYLKGSILDIDQFTHYAIGLPVVIGRLAQMLGGFSYPSVVMVLCAGAVIYYTGVYALARFWLKSIPLAMAMVVLLIKWQMFHPNVAPVIFNYPSDSIWRYPLDILFLFLLLSYLRRPDLRWLAAAGAVCGFSSFYMIDTGVYMSIAYVFYVLFNLILDTQGAPIMAIRAKALKAAGLILIAPMTCLGCLWLTQGQYLFTSVFWGNLAERTSLFLMGHGNLPMYKSLIEGKYLESWVSFIIPWAYVFVLVLISTLLFLKKISREYLFIATVSVYGLGLYHYYVVRSADTSYDAVVLPFVFILGFFLNAVIGRHPWRRAMLAGVLGISFFALLTNQYFLNYPDLLQLSQNPITRPFVFMKLGDGLSFFNHNDVVILPQIKLPVNSLGQTDEMLKTEKDFADDRQLKDFFNREFDFSQDAALIARLTGKDDRVALISSFETRILMQADRRPFFYYCPLIDSRPMHMRMFPFTSLWTTGRLRKTMQQLQEERPGYIFMEKILMAQSVPSSYEYLYPGLLEMLNFIHRYYVPYEQGKFLVAMKLK